MIIVSACLADLNTAWDGKSRTCKKVIELIKRGVAIPVCPEQMGGLTTPRQPAEKIGNRVIDIKQNDVTDNFVRGSEESFKLLKTVNAKYAILKAKSPSCGFREIYDGTFKNVLVSGNGIFAQKLVDNNIKILTENDLEEYSIDELITRFS